MIGIQYKPYLEGDNRKNQRRSCISIVKLRQIAEEGNSIHANIGTATAKISRILAQAESWYEKHQSLLERCNLEHSQPQSPRSVVQLSEMSKAVESAASSVSLDLDEAMELKRLMKRIEKWFDRATVMAPKRSKRHNSRSKSKVTVEDLVSLIEEASRLPVDTDEELKRLQMQLSVIQTWRSSASHELEKITSGFQLLRERINTVYGPPKEFSRDGGSKSNDDDDRGDETGGRSTPAHGNLLDSTANKIPEDPCDDSMSRTDTSTTGSEADLGIFSSLDKGDFNVHRMIKEFEKGAKETGVVTAEVEISDLLDSVSRWCVRSLKYLDSPKEIFDKRFFGAFDRFIRDGNELYERSTCSGFSAEDIPVAEALSSSWGTVVSDQLERLEILRAEREQYTVWCDAAAQVLSDEKKLTVEKVQELADESRAFPSSKFLCVLVL